MKPAWAQQDNETDEEYALWRADYQSMRHRTDDLFDAQRSPEAAACAEKWDWDARSAAADDEADRRSVKQVARTAVGATHKLAARISAEALLATEAPIEDVVMLLDGLQFAVGLTAQAGELLGVAGQEPPAEVKAPPAAKKKPARKKSSTAKSPREELTEALLRVAARIQEVGLDQAATEIAAMHDESVTAWRNKIKRAATSYYSGSISKIPGRQAANQAVAEALASAQPGTQEQPAPPEPDEPEPPVVHPAPPTPTAPPPAPFTTPNPYA